MSQAHDLAAFVTGELRALANPELVEPMQRYLKTDMPFFGVKKPGQRAIARLAKKRFAPADAAAYRRNVLALWSLPHREEKYVAIDYARRHKAFITLDALAVYERLVREGAWWDLIDDVAANLVGKLALDHPREMRPVLHAWIEDEDMWIRRTAILAQLRHKEATNAPMLFDFCRRCAPEKVFWIRKAIGWALRTYAAIDPVAVRDFLLANREALSGLSVREAKRGVVREGVAMD